MHDKKVIYLMFLKSNIFWQGTDEQIGIVTFNCPWIIYWITRIKIKASMNPGCF